MRKEDKELVCAGGIAGAIASRCCVGPVVLVLLGLAGVSTALSIWKVYLAFYNISINFLWNCSSPLSY